jgi:CheY-like chemotaxis protein
MAEPRHLDLLKCVPGQITNFPEAARQRPAREHLRILAVDDQRFTRTLLYQVLRTYGGYLVDTTADAREALHLYLQHAHDIAFLDIEIAGDNGHTLASIIKEIDPESYLVMVTASHLPEDAERAKANKVDGFIVKPFNREKIHNCIDAYMRRRKEKPVEADHERLGQSQ